VLLAALAQATCVQPFEMPLMVKGTIKERAEGASRYFDLVNARFPKYKWKLGSKTAHKWLRLIKNGSPSEAEVGALVDTVATYRWWSTGWSDLAHGVSEWACTLGFPGVDFNFIPQEFPKEPEEIASPSSRTLV
jgi:hypothetical protein